MRRNKLNTNKNRKVNIFFKIIFVIYLVISIMFFVYGASLNMLPTFYLVIVGILDLIITSLICLGILKGKGKKVLNVICTILSVVIIIVYGYLYNYLNATMSFIDTISEEVEQTEEYHVIVATNGKFSKIEEADGKNMHVFSTGEEYNDVKNEIKTKANVTFKEDQSLIKLAEDIISQKSYFALVSASQYSMIYDDMPEILTETKIIYTTKHKIKNNVTQETVDKKSESTIEKGEFNIYISGIDTAGSINNVARSDANILVTVNTKNKKILLTSIPRDFYLTLHSKKGKDKLTHSGIYGINETVTTVEDLFDIDINYYIRVNFTTLQKLVDTLGGIDVNSDYAFYSDGCSFKKGINHLDGRKALVFSRERKSFPDGDRQRIKNQQAVITAMINKTLSSDTILTKYTSILNALKGYFQTNIEQDDISALVRNLLSDMSGWSIKSISVNGTGANKTTYSYGSQILYVMEPDMSTVNSAKEEIETVLNK